VANPLGQRGEAVTARSDAARRGWEKRREREEAAERNLSPELVPLWRKVRGSVAGRSPDARAEAMTEYAESRPREVAQALQEHAEERVALLVTEREGAEPSTAIVVLGRKGPSIRIDPPRYYAEGGRTIAYWRGVAALPVSDEGYVEDGKGERARRVSASDLEEVSRLEREIRTLTERRRMILERAADRGERVFVGRVPF
jgi:hypothetical protein